MIFCRPRHISCCWGYKIGKMYRWWIIEWMWISEMKWKEKWHTDIFLIFFWFKRTGQGFIMGKRVGKCVEKGKVMGGKGWWEVWGKGEGKWGKEGNWRGKISGGWRKGEGKGGNWEWRRNMRGEGVNSCLHSI